MDTAGLYLVTVDCELFLCLSGICTELLLKWLWCAFRLPQPSQVNNIFPTLPPPPRYCIETHERYGDDLAASIFVLSLKGGVR